MPTQTPQQAFKSVETADAVADMLNHIGWVEYVKPKLLKTKEYYTQLLVQAVLSNAPPSVDGQVATREQVAGRVYGIDIMIKTFESILREGEAALRKIEANGVLVDTQINSVL